MSEEEGLWPWQGVYTSADISLRRHRHLMELYELFVNRTREYYILLVDDKGDFEVYRGQRMRVEEKDGRKYAALEIAHWFRPYTITVSPEDLEKLKAKAARIEARIAKVEEELRRQKEASQG